MILGKVSNLAVDSKWLPSALVKGLKYLQQTDFSKLDAGKYEIDGKLMYALVQEYETVPKEQKRPEAHVKYLDIQYLVEGGETIGVALLGPDAIVAEDLLEQKDIIFYSKVKDESDISLSAGDYAVLFPEDVHRPGCHYGSGGKVKKVVLKIAVGLL